MFITNNIILSQKNEKVEITGFEFQKLPYSYNFLEPIIDAETMKIHHTKHQKKYHDKMMEVLDSKISLKKKTITELMSDLDKIGFSDGNNATWSQIKSAIESRIKDNSPGFVRAEMPEFNFAYDVEQEGPYLNVTLIIEDFVGDISFDEQEFSDDILTEIFYKK